jgi:hypothetical protein
MWMVIEAYLALLAGNLSRGRKLLDLAVDLLDEILELLQGQGAGLVNVGLVEDLLGLLAVDLDLRVLLLVLVDQRPELLDLQLVVLVQVGLPEEVVELADHCLLRNRGAIAQSVDAVRTLNKDRVRQTTQDNRLCNNSQGSHLDSQVLIGQQRSSVGLDVLRQLLADLVDQRRSADAGRPDAQTVRNVLGLLGVRLRMEEERRSACCDPWLQ